MKVIAFDTTYLVRHIVQDDKEQCEIVASILERETLEDRSIRILDLVLLETSWVLQAVYGLDRGANGTKIRHSSGSKSLSKSLSKQHQTRCSSASRPDLLTPSPRCSVDSDPDFDEDPNLSLILAPLDRGAWTEIVEALLDDSAFCFDDPTRLRAVMKLYREGNADFADYLILGTTRSETLELKTFDKKLLKEIQGKI